MKENKRKQWEASFFFFFLFFFFTSEPAGFPARGEKANMNSYFRPESGLTNDPGLSYSPRLCSLRS